MNRLDLESYKKYKEEYDKHIRSLDYKIVETFVELYNAKSKKNQFKEDENQNKITQLENQIEFFELEKKKLTNELWEKVLFIKRELRATINNKIKINPKEINNYLIAIFTLNKITDVYFNINELIGLAYLLEDTGSETSSIALKNKINYKEKTEENIYEEEKQDINNIEKEIKKELKTSSNVQIFNIEEQRIIDFENLLNHINNISRECRKDIEGVLNRFIINYKLVKNTQYLQNDFDNIANRYLGLFKEVFDKFKKDESIEALQDRIRNRENQIKDIDERLLTNNIALKEIQRQMQELAKIYFVGSYVKKIEDKIAIVQGQQEVNKQNNNDKLFISKKSNIINAENDVFEKIKKLSYDKRMNHIIEVSKWTKNLEEKLKGIHMEETDFQFVIYLIRQTENMCNANFEQVANLIINLCDTNLQLEVVENNQSIKNKKLQDEITITKILKDGIGSIKKKYSKIPFIGRKVSSILSAKLLNE